MYHVISRGNAQHVFRKREDYAAFVRLMVAANRRLPIRLTGYCLLPNHFHLVLWPYGDGDLSRWMQWLLTAHVRRSHRHYRGSGHVWQGQFKAFPVEQDEHYLIVLRYVERNALRAELMPRAEDWPWCILSRKQTPASRDCSALARWLRGDSGCNKLRASRRKANCSGCVKASTECTPAGRWSGPQPPHRPWAWSRPAVPAVARGKSRMSPFPPPFSSPTTKEEAGSRKCFPQMLWRFPVRTSSARMQPSNPSEEPTSARDGPRSTAVGSRPIGGGHGN